MTTRHIVYIYVSKTFIHVIKQISKVRKNLTMEIWDLTVSQK